MTDDMAKLEIRDPHGVVDDLPWLRGQIEAWARGAGPEFVVELRRQTTADGVAFPGVMLRLGSPCGAWCEGHVGCPEDAAEYTAWRIGLIADGLVEAMTWLKGKAVARG